MLLLRCVRAGSMRRRTILCLWFLLLGLSLVALGLFDLAYPDRTLPEENYHPPPPHPFKQFPDEPPDLEEDDLLLVASWDAERSSRTPELRRRGAYKMLRRGRNRDHTGEERTGQQVEGLGGGQEYGWNGEEADGPMDALRRTWPERRHPACLGEQYSEALPSASVVIPGRLGAAGCRSLGASAAVGEVLVFVEPHCECHPGWLEPLLERVAQDRTRVVSPVMDVIDGLTFQYNATLWPVRGVFDWRLDFHWEPIPPPQAKDPDSVVEAVRSPALGGGVLAVDKLFFQSIGGSDPGLMLRGAEQIQLSIRVWSCGGSLEVVPCSRVAHLAPPPPPTPPDPQLLERDKIRLADTWMDAETPDVTEQAELKKSLRCKDFHWFLSTVYPQLYIPQDRPGLSGELYHVGTGYCADAPGERTLPGAILEVAPCSGTGKQHWELNSQGEVRWGPSGGLCLDPRGERVILSACPSRQPTLSRLQWRFLKLSGQLIHLESQLCLEAQREGGASQRGGVASQRGGVASQREGGASQRGAGPPEGGGVASPFAPAFVTPVNSGTLSSWWPPEGG
ncbi:hypothetical protein NHX12_023386 [Muraenolepis orangiensis]|uniref:Polypeptide N-acetylgalactosaminyltransferase n=1 Tax=Muraenolepis orangiensis TaxID=630683 RepID=A0A9Q0EKZ7_9TELE|nr:hypothetical protein NHX12_023386 [Muraenolepis orangiensis]